MLVSSKKIEKMLRDRDRLERMAKIEYQEAKNLFSVGNMEFAIELQLANQHLGASREITRTLKNIGYEECKRMSEKEKQLLIAGIKQKLCGIGVIGVGVFFCIFRDAGCIYCIVSNWKHFMCFKRKCCNYM